MSATEKNLSPKQHRAVEALLTSAGVAEAAAVVGVAPSSVYRWLKDPTFREALVAGEREATRQTGRALAAMARLALKALEDGLRHSEIKIRLRAAECYFSRATAWRESSELDQRVETLERNLLI